jgi:O-antigen/teichoic acid export membrane protein
MAANTAIQLGGVLIGLVSGIIVNALLGRYLGKEGYGYFSLALSFVVLFMGVFADWGLGVVAVRRLAAGSDAPENLLPGVASLQAVISILTYLLLVGALFALQQTPEVRAAALVFGVTILLLPIDSLACFFQARLLMRYPVTANAIGRLASLLLIGGAIILKGSMVAVMSASLAAVACQYAVTLFLLKRHVKFDWHAHRERWKGLLRDAWPLALGSIFVVLVNQIPIIMLGRTSTPGDVGLYAAVSRMMMLLLAVPIAFGSVVYPVLSRIHAEDRETFRKVARIAIEMMLVLILPILTVVTLFASRIVALLYGPDFAPAGKVLEILIWADVLLFPGIVTGNTLLAAGMQRVTLVMNAAALALLLGAIYFMPAAEPIVGMAVAVWLCYLVLMGGELAVVAIRFRGIVGWRMWFALSSSLVGPVLLIGSGSDVHAAVVGLVAGVAIVSCLLLLSGARAWKQLFDIVWLPREEKGLSAS